MRPRRRAGWRRARVRRGAVQRHLRQLRRRALHRGVAAVDQHLRHLASVACGGVRNPRGMTMPTLILPAPQQRHQLLGRVRALGAVSTTPVASMSMTSAREAAVLAWSAMPASRPRKLKLMA